LRRGPDVTSNAAHNVFLDISAYGGFPLLLIYLALMVLVVISAVKVLKRSQGFNAGFVGLVAGWVAFQAQSIISINQIGLALWGWVWSGLIIGYEMFRNLCCFDNNTAEESIDNEEEKDGDGDGV
jgi:O-antigen ligase